MTLLETIIIALTGGAQTPADLSCYQVAGHCLAVDRPLDPLEPFITKTVDAMMEKSGRMPASTAGPGELICDGEGWVGGATRRIRSWNDGSNHEIRIAGIGAFSVSADGREIILLEKAEGCDDGALIETVLGPVLILALTIGGVFCFHASAVTLGGGAVLFLGESGEGKSTLARVLPRAGTGITRLTDDISPLRIAGERVELLPDFPQLKLSAEQQVASPEDASPRKVDAIYTLNRVPAEETGAGGVSSRRLGPAESFSRLTGQSVASRIFTDDLLGRHARQTAGLVNLVPVRELTYPGGAEHFDTVRKFLQRTFG